MPIKKTIELILLIKVELVCGWKMRAYIKNQMTICEIICEEIKKDRNHSLLHDNVLQEG